MALQLHIVLKCKSAEEALELQELLGRERPDFEEDVAEGYLPHYQAIEDFSYPEEMQAEGSFLCVQWYRTDFELADAIQAFAVIDISVIAFFSDAGYDLVGDTNENEPQGLHVLMNKGWVVVDNNNFQKLFGFSQTTVLKTQSKNEYYHYASIAASLLYLVGVVLKK